MNRRKFLLGTTAAAAALLANLPGPGGDHFIVPPAEALFLRGGGAAASAPSVPTTVTMANTAATASGANTPIQVPQWFGRGVVPSGSIATPSVSGQSITWQADNRVYWDDGSLMGAVFRIVLPSGIAGSGTIQVSFAVAAGSYTNTSSNTVADVTAGSDYKVLLANLHTTQLFSASIGGVGASESLQIGFTLSGGAVSGGVVQWNDQASTAGPNGTTGGGTHATVLSGTYNSTTGATVLTLSTPVTGAGISQFVLSGMTGTGSIASLDGHWTDSNAPDSPSTTLNFIAPTGLTLTISGGTATSAYTLVNGAATGGAPTTPAVVTIDGMTVGVFSGGAGYGYLAASDSAGFNAAATLWNNGIGQYAGVQLQQYAKGPVCDAWVARMPFTTPHLIGIFYVERWKTPAGALLAFRATAHVTNSSFDTTHTIYNYTFDANWQNGATVIRGAALSSPGWTTMMVNEAGSFRALDDGSGAVVNTGRLDWSANDTAYKAIVQQRTAAECTQLSETRLLPKWLTTYNGGSVGSNITNDAGLPTVGFNTPPTTQAINSVAGINVELTIIPLCRPMSLGGCRAAEGSGGTGHNEALIPDNSALHWLALVNGDTASARTWLVSARAAANNFCSGANASPLLDPTALCVPCVVPAGDQTFGPMPDLSTKDASFFTEGGYTSQILNAGSGGGPISACLTSYHLPRYSVYPYLIEGEQWMLDDLVFTAGNMVFYPHLDSQTSNRSCALGATTYNALFCAANQPRVFAWGAATLAYAAKLCPTAYADGGVDHEQAYLQYVLKKNFDFAWAFVQFSGTVTPSGNTGTPKVDWTTTTGTFNAGIWAMPAFVPSSLDTSGNVFGELTEWLYTTYLGHILPFAAYLWQDHGSGNGIPSIKSFCNYLMVGYAGAWAFSGSHFMADSWNQSAYVGPAPNSPPVHYWATIGGPTQANWPNLPLAINWTQQSSQEGQNTTSGSIGLNFTSGNPVISVIEADTGNPGTPAGMMFERGTGGGGVANGATLFANGSAIMMTLYNIDFSGSIYQDACTNANVVLPVNFTSGQWYYIGNSTWTGTQQTFNLYDTQAHALAGGTTGRVTPGSTVCGIQAFGAPANTPPADNSGQGTYNGGDGTSGETRAAAAYGSFQMAQWWAFTASGQTSAYPELDTSTGIANSMAAAAANCNTILTSIPGFLNFADEPIEAMAAA